MHAQGSSVERSDSLARGWIILAGAVLILAGIAGFIPNALVGRADSLVVAGPVHSAVHVLTGLIALGIGFGLRGESQVNAVIGFGVLYVVILVAVLVSPNLFGLFEYNSNAAVHAIHAAVAVVSLAVGSMARNAMRPALTR